MTTPVGIDLGTTNTAAAYVDAVGSTAMIANTEGDLLTPSVVLFEDEAFVVGKEAKHAVLTEPTRVAEWVKRDMGQPAYNRPIRGEKLPPEVIQGCILHRIEREVALLLGNDYKAVITVPAYFDEPRRTATAAAAEMAGIPILDIVNEPTAAALAFGEATGYLNAKGDIRKELTVLVYDLGGGTFDVSLLKLSPGDVTMLASDGDVKLGGFDWDNRVVEHLADQIEREHGRDIRNDDVGYARLYEAAVQAKHTLSARQKATIRIVHSDIVFKTEITRDKFERLTVDLLERTAHTVREVLRTGDMMMQDVDRVLLVGGSTRMPMVLNMLERLGAASPAKNVHPDEAVARGAAIYAQYLLGKENGGSEESSLSVTNVSAHTLGLSGIELETGRKVAKPVIRKNMPLPARKRKKFCTKEGGQKTIVVQVLEGENPSPDECTSVARTVIRNLPDDLPKGHPIRVTFEYGANGRLNVSAQIEGTDRSVDLELERNVILAPERLARWREIIVHDAGFHDFEAAAVVEFHETPTDVDEDATEGWGGSDSASPSSTTLTESALDWVDPEDVFAMAMMEEREEKQKPVAAPPRQTANVLRAAVANPQQERTALCEKLESQDAEEPGPFAGSFSDDAFSSSAPSGMNSYQEPGDVDEDDLEGAYEEADEDDRMFQSGSVRSGNGRQSKSYSHALIFIVGIIISSLVGLGAGYIIVTKFFPAWGLPSPW